MGDESVGKIDHGKDFGERNKRKKCDRKQKASTGQRVGGNEQGCVWVQNWNEIQKIVKQKCWESIRNTEGGGSPYP